MPLTSSNETPPYTQQSAANTFFHNPDLCTLLTATLLSTTPPLNLDWSKWQTWSSQKQVEDFPPHKAIPISCRTPSPTHPLLPFRGITRSTHNAVMSEHRPRAALGLDPQDELATGLIVLATHAKCGNTHPSYSHCKVDLETFLAREVEDEEDEKEGEGEGKEVRTKRHQQRTVDDTWPPRRRDRIARVFTHHPAATHQNMYDDLDGTTLYITAEAFSLCSSSPLAREMFLTQPPQRKIRFGVRYEYSPGTRRYFTLRNEAGIRFRDLVDFFEREPGMMKRPVDPDRGMGLYKRWLRDADFQWMNRIEWEFTKGVVLGGALWRKASDFEWWLIPGNEDLDG